MVDRDYYRTVWGFDPEAERRLVSPSSSEWMYESYFELKNDPDLNRAGVLIGAQVTFGEEETNIRNRIVFLRGTKKAFVHCVHTAIYSGSLSEFNEFDELGEEQVLELARSTENKPVSLPPEEHFVALRSYVDGIASLGISNALNLSYLIAQDPEMQLPFGFNSMMRNQVLTALQEVAMEVCWTLFKNYPSDVSLDFLYALASSPKTPQEALTPLLDDARWEARAALVDNPNISPVVLGKLSYDYSVWVRKRLAQHPHLPPHILVRLALDPYWEVREQVAGNPSTPLRVLEYLSYSTDSFILQNLGRNERTPASVLEFLSQGDNEEILLEVAHNPHTPEAILQQLSTRNSRRIKVAIVDNPNAPVTTLERLIFSPDRDIYQTLAHNSLSHSEILKSLYHNLDVSIIKNIAQILNGNFSIKNGLWDFHILVALAQNPQTSPDTLQLLYRIIPILYKQIRTTHTRVKEESLKKLARFLAQFQYEIWDALAGNPHSPTEILERLAENANDHILWKLSGNPKTPNHIIDEYIILGNSHYRMTGDAKLLLIIARRTNLDESTVKDLLDMGIPHVLREFLHHHEKDDRVLELFATDPKPAIRSQLLRLVDSRPNLFERLARDPNPTVRKKVAQHPHLPKSLFPLLVADPFPKVQKALAKRLDAGRIVIDLPSIDTSDMDDGTLGESVDDLFS